MSPVTHCQSPLAMTLTPLAGPKHWIGVGTAQSTWQPTDSARIWQAVLPDLVMTNVEPYSEGRVIAAAGGFCGGGCAGRPPASVPPRLPTGDLGLSTPMATPLCNGQRIVILGNVTTPGLYEDAIQQL